MTTPSYGFLLSDTDVLLVLIIVNEDNRLEETQPADNDVHIYHFTGLLIRASSIPSITSVFNHDRRLPPLSAGSTGLSLSALKGKKRHNL